MAEINPHPTGVGKRGNPASKFFHCYDWILCWSFLPTYERLAYCLYERNERERTRSKKALHRPPFGSFVAHSPNEHVSP